MDNYGVPSAMLDEYKEKERALDDVKRRISEKALASIDLKKGDLVIDQSNGYQYRLDWCSVWLDRHIVRVSCSGRRVWKSGRKAGREAHTNSFLNFTDLKKA